VNGTQVVANGKLAKGPAGQRLLFNR
jgi:hypothetical protein